MTDAEAATDTRVDVYLRERVPPPVSETIEATLERLRTLEREGVIQEVSVDSWGLCGVHGAEQGETVATTIREFEEWADRTDHTLRPAFDRQEVTSAFCEGTVRRHDVPILSIAVYDGGTLQCVAPCSDDDRTHTVEDCLDALGDQDEVSSDSDVPLANAGQS